MDIENKLASIYKQLDTLDLSIDIVFQKNSERLNFLEKQFDSLNKDYIDHIGKLFIEVKYLQTWLFFSMSISVCASVVAFIALFRTY